jgi:hypothetical protein
MEVKKYKNRYGDVFTFTEDDFHDIIWEGNFEFCRIGMPNDYTDAYKKYYDDECIPPHDHTLSISQFKIAVHEYDDKINDYTDFAKKYMRLVKSLENEIDMIDPSGGCYISRGMSLDFVGFKNYVVKDFKQIKTGYKIITEKCNYCHQAGGIHKMSCQTRKILINIMNDDETLGLYNE